ncbi:hypothetical protein D7V97_01505 [Corallococcus sp. CA053C]|uniref:hypothetical protein n=1 Tax=Corallococcus sp. CA053C TaxID=2316732 RepID=UPI000EA04F02|nr:hypothetical protein [Corallococcus sp. CA053C]RKH14938.1 hypothetical protein D7V97_01505 [Corallococcus sp. CA053C]
MLCWFLERTDFSFVYAADVPSAELFPVELKRVAVAETRSVVDLAVTEATLLSAFIGKQVNPGATALFRGIELVVVLPSLLATPEAQLINLLFSQVPEYKQLKQEGRATMVTSLLQATLPPSLMDPDASVLETHRWTDAEMEQTIDLHLAHRADPAARADAIKELARNLKLGVGQVSMAVDAVGTLDPKHPRRYPKPSKKLARLWEKRGYQNKLGK